MSTSSKYLPNTFLATKLEVSNPEENRNGALAELEVVFSEMLPNLPITKTEYELFAAGYSFRFHCTMIQPVMSDRSETGYASMKYNLYTRNDSDKPMTAEGWAFKIIKEAIAKAFLEAA